MADLLGADFQMPANDKLERRVLGLALISPEHLYTLLADESGTELFYPDGHKVLYSTFAMMAERGDPVDQLTVLGELIKQGRLEQAGGGRNLSELTTDTGKRNTENLGHYLCELRELAEKRAFIKLCHRGIVNALEAGISFREAAGQYEEDFHMITAADYGRRVLSLDETIDKSMDEIFNPAHPNRQTLTTGIRQLDDATRGGPRAGEYWVYGAMTGRGKTSAGRQCAAANVLRGVPTLVFSVEMSREQWEQQTMATHAKVAADKMRTPDFLNVVERQRLKDAMDHFRGLPMYIDSSSPLHIRELVARARLAIRRDHVKLVVVDYLQTITAPGKERIDRAAYVWPRCATWRRTKTSPCSRCRNSVGRTISTIGQQ